MMLRALMSVDAGPNNAVVRLYLDFKGVFGSKKFVIDEWLYG